MSGQVWTDWPRKGQRVRLNEAGGFIMAGAKAIRHGHEGTIDSASPARGWTSGPPLVMVLWDDCKHPQPVTLARLEPVETKPWKPAIGAAVVNKRQIAYPIEGGTRKIAPGSKAVVFGIAESEDSPPTFEVRFAHSADRRFHLALDEIEPAPADPGPAKAYEKRQGARYRLICNIHVDCDPKRLLLAAGAEGIVTGGAGLSKPDSVRFLADVAIEAITVPQDWLEPVEPTVPAHPERPFTIADACQPFEVRTHEVKCWPFAFAPIAAGDKPFEVRKDDRGYQRGDLLRIREWDPALFETRLALDSHVAGHPDVIQAAHEAAYTGEEVTKRITWILTGGQWGIEPGYVVLGLGEP